MKKLIILFLLIGQILNAQTFDEPVYFKDKVNAYKYISVTDSMKAGYLVLPSKSSYPLTARVNTIINYNGSLEYYNGSTWVSLMGYTLPTSSTTVKGGAKIGIYVSMTGDSIGVDTTSLKTWLLSQTVGSANKLQGTWDTTTIKQRLHNAATVGFGLNAPSIQYFVVDTFEISTKNYADSIADKVTTKADTSLVNDTAYAIRQTVNTKLSTVSHDATLTGTGTALNVLKVDTNLIGTNKAIHDSVIFNLTGKQTKIGDWDASGNVYPSINVHKGDWWTITVKGFVGGTDSVFVDDLIIAKINNPGQTTTNWIINSAASSGVTVTGQKFNSSTKGVGVLYNGLTPLEGTISGGSTSPVGTTAILDVNGNLWASGYIRSKSYVYSGSVGSMQIYSNKTMTSYPSYVYTNSSFSAYPIAAVIGSPRCFGSIYNSSSFWNTTGAGSAERHAYRMTVDGTPSTSPVSYLNFGYAKNEGTELIASRLGMTGDWSHLLGANTYYLTSYTGGTLSQPVTNDKATSATSTAFNWYNYTAGDWARIGYLSNTGQLTLGGGIRLPQDSVPVVGNDTVALLSDLDSIDVNVNEGLVKNTEGVIGLDSVNLTTGDSITYRDKNIYAGIYNYKTAPYYSIGSSLQLNQSYGTLNYIYRDDTDPENIYPSISGQLGGTQNDVFMSYTSNGKSYSVRADTNNVYILKENQAKKDSFEILTKYQIKDLINPKYDTLSATSTIITYNAAVNPYRTDTIGENHTYHINGAVNGSEGDLYVYVSGGTPTITLPSGTLKGTSLTSMATGYYHICWRKVWSSMTYSVGFYPSYTGY